MYQLAMEIMDSKERRWLRILGFGNSPAGILPTGGNSAPVPRILRRLRRLADEHTGASVRKAYHLFSYDQAELDDDYLATIQRHLRPSCLP
jgi:hypothetical protein